MIPWPFGDLLPCLAPLAMHFKTPILSLRACIMNSATSIFILLLVRVLVSQIGASLASSEVDVYDSYNAAERLDLLELRDSLSSALNLHSRWTGPPCNKNMSRWVGITCAHSRVTGINLQSIQLTGALRPTALQNVTYLTDLDISDNALRGGLPTLKGLVHLRLVSLSTNRFSGAIPVEYAALPNLTLLDLHDNLLNGTIPAFNRQSLIALNVSYNFLQGRIPETPIMERFPIASYGHNLELCGKPLNKPCPGPSRPPPVPAVPSAPSPSAPSSPAGTKKLELLGLILVAIGAVMVPITAILCYLCYRKKKLSETTEKYENSGGVLSDFTMKRERGSQNVLDKLEFFDAGNINFNIDDLLRSSAEVLGWGKLGATYRATLASGPVVVVKRIGVMGNISKKVFVHQMQLIGKLRHENLVEIIAYYCSKDQRLIVYENVADGSLVQLLHDNRGEGRVPLNWQARLNIARGIARGLAHLHDSLASHGVPHANLKSSNILIHRYNRHHCRPKLTDFGFLPLPSPRHAQKLAIGKTPECSQGKRLTRKADIYCLGLVLLEIITGQVPEDHDDDLPLWVTSVISKEWSMDVLDLEIVAEKDRHDEMLTLMDVALQCTAREPGKRPEISVVVERIEEIGGKGRREGN